MPRSRATSANVRPCTSRCATRVSLGENPKDRRGGFARRRALVGIGNQNQRRWQVARRKRSAGRAGHHPQHERRASARPRYCHRAAGMRRCIGSRAQHAADDLLQGAVVGRARGAQLPINHREAVGAADRFFGGGVREQHAAVAAQAYHPAQPLAGQRFDQGLGAFELFDQRRNAPGVGNVRRNLRERFYDVLVGMAVPSGEFDGCQQRARSLVVDARADEIAQPVMTSQPVVEFVAAQRRLRQHAIVGEHVRSRQLHRIPRPRIDLAHARDIFVDGVVDAIDLDAFNARRGSIVPDHGRSAAADRVGGRLQGSGPRDFAETGPVPEIHDIANPIFLRHRPPPTAKVR